ncbi:MAG: formiminoglutamase [Francisellaceae bacterium]|jgi:formiminoglutamase
MSDKRSLYFPTTDKSIWSGRIDAFPQEYLFQQVKYLDLSEAKNLQQYKHGYALLGFQSDEGVRRNLGNLGAVDGPIFFRKTFAKLPIHDDFDIYDTGNVRCINGDLELAQLELKNCVAKILSMGLTPIVIGGGHETAWGHYQGIHQHFGEEAVGILNFDAHFDLRPLVEGKLGSSGTPFFQANEMLKADGKQLKYYCTGIQPFANTKRLFEYAQENNFEYYLAEKINSDPDDLSFIKKAINKNNKIYVTVCLDVFKASIAPGVSAPQALGIEAEYVIKALRLLKDSNKVVSLDIVELSPRHDVNNQTAKLASCLLMEYLHDC